MLLVCNLQICVSFLPDIFPSQVFFVFSWLPPCFQKLIWQVRERMCFLHIIKMNNCCFRLCNFRISCRPCRLFNCFLRTFQSSDALFPDRIDRLFLKLLLCTLGLEILNSRFGFLIILPCLTHTPSGLYLLFLYQPSVSSFLEKK